MEGSREIPQQPLDKTLPQTDTDFGDEQFDSTPINRSRFSGLNERIFALMRPKKPASKPQKPVVQEAQPSQPADSHKFVDPSQRLPLAGSLYAGQYEVATRAVSSASGEHEIQNGLLMRKKTLAERVRDQIRFPILKSAPSMIYGFALVVFSVGAYLLYSALPTRPDLVLGIILVSLAGNVIINNR
jgi:hypothetical protein